MAPTVACGMAPGPPWRWQSALSMDDPLGTPALRPWQITYGPHEPSDSTPIGGRTRCEAAGVRLEKYASQSPSLVARIGIGILGLGGNRSPAQSRALPNGHGDSSDSHCERAPVLDAVHRHVLRRGRTAARGGLQVVLRRGCTRDKCVKSRSPTERLPRSLGQREGLPSSRRWTACSTTRRSSSHSAPTSTRRSGAPRCPSRPTCD